MATALSIRPLENIGLKFDVSPVWNDQRVDISPVTLPNLAKAANRSVARIDSAWVPSLGNVFQEDRFRSPLGNENPVVIDAPQLFQTRRVAGRAVNTLQEWEGLVTEVSEKTLYARLRDLTKPGIIEEVAEIPLEEIDPNDLQKVIIGAIFHLIIAFTLRAGARRRETFIYFRRHLSRGQQNAQQLVDLLRATRDDVD